jgi:hypothetical protein
MLVQYLNNSNNNNKEGERTNSAARVNDGKQQQEAEIETLHVVCQGADLFAGFALSSSPISCSMAKTMRARSRCHCISAAALMRLYVEPDKRNKNKQAKSVTRQQIPQTEQSKPRIRKRRRRA